MTNFLHVSGALFLICSVTLAAEPIDLVPLYGIETMLEPATTEETPEALITHIADRARDRHAREDVVNGTPFRAYDHYLPWYWEDRTIAIEIVDRVSNGGNEIIFNYTTQTPLSAPEFRAFFRGIGTVAEYHGNYSAKLVSSNHYSKTLTSKQPEGRPLQIGDRIEIEISQFLEKPANGRRNYYGTALLYVVGKGIVPWEGQGKLLDSFPLPETAWMGGSATLPYQYSNEPKHRFKQMAGNIAPISVQPFMLGRRLHHTDFGDGSHSEPGNPMFETQRGKAGPHFVERSCIACHVNNGRALPQSVGGTMFQTVLKVGTDANGSPHPKLGSAIQPRTSSSEAEDSASIASWVAVEGHYEDCTAYTLQKPVYAFKGEAPAYYSVRLTPQLVGLGLLEAVSESTILALADPEDVNQDGISGKVRTVRDPETGDVRLGRFGYKAGQARLRHQIAQAFNSDMGVTTAVFPALDGEKIAGTTEPEIADADLINLTRYIATLGVSARRDLTTAEALRGEEVFVSAGCMKCHVSTLETSPYHPLAELRSQIIRPGTDMLLHDMGPGLADNMSEGDATGSEWRTAPLWSIGLTADVSGGEAYLHDGRARTIEEAILWHGGEGEKSKEAFRILPATDRAALVTFLKSL